MQFAVLFVLCWLASSLNATQDVKEKPLPRYTLLTESKRKDQELQERPTDVLASEKQPWRRFAYAGLTGQQTSWPGSQQAAIHATSLGPGLLLLGVNIGALLYMLLGLLGLAPAQRVGAWHPADIYGNNGQHMGKESTVYF